MGKQIAALTLEICWHLKSKCLIQKSCHQRHAYCWTFAFVAYSFYFLSGQTFHGHLWHHDAWFDIILTMCSAEDWTLLLICTSEEEKLLDLVAAQELFPLPENEKWGPLKHDQAKKRVTLDNRYRHYFWVHNSEGIISTSVIQDLFLGFLVWCLGRKHLSFMGKMQESYEGQHSFWTWTQKTKSASHLQGSFQSISTMSKPTQNRVFCIPFWSGIFHALLKAR